MKSFISYLLIILILGVTMPVDLWHECDHERTILDFSDGMDADESCDICNFLISHFDGETRIADLKMECTNCAPSSYLTSCALGCFVSLTSDRAPPVFT